MKSQAAEAREPIFQPKKTCTIRPLKTGNINPHTTEYLKINIVATFREEVRRTIEQPGIRLWSFLKKIWQEEDTFYERIHFPAKFVRALVYPSYQQSLVGTTC